MACFNTHSRGHPQGFRIALFGPQVTHWTRESLSDLQSTLLEGHRFGFLKQTLAGLPLLWSLLETDFGSDCFSGLEKLKELRDFATGAGDLNPQDLTNTHLAPLTVVSQVVDLIQSTSGPNDEECLPVFEAAQGFCIGFLSAAALASADKWAVFERSLSNAIRLAACIGIVVDVEDASRPLQDRSTAISVRWKTAADRAYLDSCLESIPESRHNKVAEKLSSICAKNGDLQLPDSEELRLPLRSTADGQIVNGGALHDVAIQLILCRRAHWFQTVKLTMSDLPADKITFRPLGREACVPRSLSASHKQTNTSACHDDPTELEEIAVVGMACRFPKAESLEEFWQLLRKGDTALSKIPLERFNPAELSREPKLANFWGNFLNNPGVFDHRFFGISGREAKSMDPQQRLALQVAYEALESSGYFSAAPTSHKADVGLYLGVGSVDYEDNVASENANAFAATGTLRAFISGRISHFFGWTGPSLTFDTACSSSAVAIHVACKALLGGECSMALAGGVNVITSPTLHQNLAAASFLNPNGSSRAFDAEAGGYCRGEGTGILVLKPLSKAIVNGDTVLGVISASAVNQSSNCSSITVPNSGSQSTLYKRVLSAARMAPKDVTYVEAHGTGTPVGDPIEYESVRLALTGPWRDEELFLGSVKDSIGHAEAASGVAGVIKTLLMMQYKTIPKQPNFVTLHPRIKAFPSDRITVPKTTQPWTNRRHIALVNNYGAAGSNVALLLRAYSAPVPSSREVAPGARGRPSPSTVYPILLSAKTPNHLRLYLDELKLYLPKAEALADVAYKIARSHNLSFEHRIAFTAPDVETAIASLDSSRVKTDGTATPKAKYPVVLCFGGQTGRKVAVSRDLYDSCDLFKAHLDECDAVCQALGLPSILPSIFHGDDTEDIVSLHCMLLALQVSSAKCWIDCGLEVDTLIGHSFGQLAALCVADCISLDDTFRLVSGRARLIHESWGLEGGAMLSIECGREEIEAVVRRVNSAGGLRVDIACYNGPRSFVLAGSVPSIEKAKEECRPFKTTRVGNTHAYHSYLADAILDGLATVAESIDIRPPCMHVETCTAKANWSRFTANEVVQHTREPVYFAEAIERIVSRLPSAVWVEAGSASPIITMTRRIAAKPGRSDIFTPMDLGSPDAVANLAKATCQLWKAGSAAQYWPFHKSSHHRYQQVNIPPYQFEKTRHWIQYRPKPEPREVGLVTLLPDGGSMGESLFSVDTSNAIFELAVRGHAVAGHSLCPASMYIELAARCAKAIPNSTETTRALPHIEGVSMSSPLGLGAGIAVFVRLSLRNTAQESWDFTVLSRRSTDNGAENTETEHAKGHISWVPPNDVEAGRRLKLLTRFGPNRSRKMPSDTGLSGSMVYKMFSDVVKYASYYRGVQSVSASDNEAVGIVAALTGPPFGLDDGICDPISIDKFLQVAGIHVNCLSQREDNEVFICVGLEEIVFSSYFMANRNDSRVWTVQTRYDALSEFNITNDIFVCDADSGDLVLAIIGAAFKSVPFKSLARNLAGLNRTANKVTDIVAAPHSSDNDAVSDSAYDTGTPSVNDDACEKQPFQRPDAAEPQLPVVRSSQAVVAHRQPPDGPNESGGVLQSICNMFAAILEVPIEEIRPTSKLDHLGIDSLLVTEVLAEIQTRFQINLPQEQFAKCADIFSVAQLIRPIETKKPEKVVEGEQAEKQQPGDRSTIRPPMPEPETNDRRAHDEKQHEVILAAIARNRFAEAKVSYDRHAENTGFAGFCTEVFPIQTELVVQYIISGLAPLGCNLRALNPGDVVPAFHFSPKHNKLIPQLYKILEDAGLVAKGGDGVFRRTPLSLPTVPALALHEELLRKFPKHASETKLLHTTASKLAECLSGEVDPLALLFRDSAARTLLGDVYTNAPMFKTGTLLLSQYLSSILERVGDQREVKILELGAGTGGTSRHLIEALATLGPKYKFSYTFTDLSPSLVAKARRTFSKWPCMHYSVLDIEKDPEPQCIAAYDIIVSTNCIHATKSVVQSTTNIRKMLRPDGVLCLVELTRNLYWFDLVFGLLEGWWLFNDGREHALAHERRWEQALRAAGFEWIDWSNSSLAESDILRVITASPYKLVPDIDSVLTDQASSDQTTRKQTMVFKAVDGLQLHADVYYPPETVEPGRRLPVALMIHGGGHIMLSRKDVRPQQTDMLLRSGFLPISVDYRLCPETTLHEGPMVDVADALVWIRAVLPTLTLSRRDVRVDADKVVAVGWSTGGHLAMTLAWTTVSRQIRPPEAILAFYCPTDYEDPFWTTHNVPDGAQTADLDPAAAYELDDQIWAGVFDSPITGYNVRPTERALGGWMAPGDARSRLALHMNWHGRTLQVLLGGLDKKTREQHRATPAPERVAAVSPLAQVRGGSYTTPTFLIHPRQDDLIPWQQAEHTWRAMRAAGMEAQLRIVEDVPHLFDILPEHRGNEMAAKAVQEGYQFLCGYVGLTWRG
ncbi:hypothetical protein DL770_011874 [Monosporascus sp. CRB-9-2]|nr:hypothetical protein DL770_011874 [Monosporascus sp. CRB-9-2]